MCLRILNLLSYSFAQAGNYPSDQSLSKTQRVLQTYTPEESRKIITQLWVGLRDLRLGQHLGALAILGCIVVIVWGLLNGLLFYKARGLFVKDAGPKK